MPTQIEKACALYVLHEHSGTFVTPNPWGPGLTRLLASVDFEALTSTNAGFAFSRGLPDYDAGHNIIFVYVADLVAATDVPMAADLENGFDDAPETVAETIRLADVVGIVGGSTEDATGHADASIYLLEASVDRVCAAVEAAYALSLPFTLAARSENHLHGYNNLTGTIRRLQAFQDVGADVPYAPGLKTHDETAVVLREINRPLNVLMGFADGSLSVTELAELGVRHISVGVTLTHVVMGTLMRTMEELRAAGAFNFARDVASGARLNGLFAPFI